MEFIPKGDTTESEENTESDKIEVPPEKVEEPMEEQIADDLDLEVKIISDDALEDSPQENIAIEDETEIEEGDLDAEKERKVKYRQYKMPTLEFLNDPVEIRNTHSEEELKEKANSLAHALDTFGVTGRVVRISPGPVITLFEIEPAEGVRVNKFTNLSDDIARVMKAQRVRIIAPIPGSKSVGIEIQIGRAHV